MCGLTVAQDVASEWAIFNEQRESMHACRLNDSWHPTRARIAENLWMQDKAATYQGSACRTQ